MIIFFLIILLCVKVNSDALCSNINKSCTNHLWGSNTNTPADACYMIHYRLNGTECSELKFKSTESNNKLGDVRLTTFTDDEFIRTGFSLILSNISWTGLDLRYAQIDRENVKNMCRSFKIWKNTSVPSSAYLNYDCQWSEGDYEGTPVALEYQMFKETAYMRKYIFRVPRYSGIESGVPLKRREIFSYVDVTDADLLKLHIQPLPKKYNVSSYKVEVYREIDNSSYASDLRILRADDFHDGELIYVFKTYKQHGLYYFAVSAIGDGICEEDECLKTYTPKIFIDRGQVSFLIGIVGVSAVIPIFLYILYTLILRKQRLKSKGNYDVVKDESIKLFIMYDPVLNDLHNATVKSLVQLLRQLSNWTVLMDVLDIPGTADKDPISWCADAFEAASHVVYVVALEVDKSVTNNIYDVYGTSLNYVREEINNRSSRKKIIRLRLPYCAGAVPKEFKNFREFSLMSQFETFLNFIGSSKTDSVVKNNYRDFETFKTFMDCIQRTEESLRSADLDKEVVVLNKKSKLRVDGGVISVESEWPSPAEPLVGQPFDFDLQKLDLCGNGSPEDRSSSEFSCVNSKLINLEL